MSQDQPDSPLSANSDFDRQQIKKAILKNVAIISFSFLLSFTAFSGTINLQSSLNNEGDLGNKALTALNLGAIISNLFISIPATSTLGLKWSLIISLFTHITFPMSNFYPTWYTLYMGAFITGLGAGPLWSAKSSYLTILGEQYSKLVNEDAEASISRFFGIFYMIYHGSTLTGNVISSLIFQRPPTTASLLPSTTLSKICGVNYCYQNLNEIFQSINYSYMKANIILKNVTSNFNDHFVYNINETIPSKDDYGNYGSFYKPTPSQIYLLFGIYLVCDILACPLASFVIDLKTVSSEKSLKSIWSHIIYTFLHMKNPKEIMLFPLAFFSGVSYAFITADYSMGFVTCTLGIDNVGYVMTTFGSVAGLASIIFGPLLKYIGRQAIFIFGATLNIAVLVAMLHWTPSSEMYYVLYVFAALWGVCHCIWTSQLIAFIGFVFSDVNKQTAFTCNYLWQMLGNCLWHAFSIYFCIYTQAYVMIAMITIGILGYLGVEILLRNANKK